MALSAETIDISTYKREPLKLMEDIPVFCESNDYQENYEKISSDHLSELEKTGINPFMNPYLWEAIENNTVSLLNKYLKQGDKVLDVGVGTGRLLGKLKGNFKKFGVDISSKYLKLAKSQNIDVCMAFVEELPYSDSSFDLIVTTDVLEHVLDLNTAVKEILRVLKPDGTLIVRVPYKESLKAYMQSDYKYVHLRNFDEYSLSLFFQKIMNCKVLEYNTSGGLVTREHLKEYFPNLIKIAFFLSIHAIKFINSRLWRKLADKFYPHSEINIVVKKS